ncbi:50S ribosomal protein L15 [Candidatus Marinamargulisbacteria bacterium SCGC AG-410-N11]|nr:50S ribosomal protein L15 [Candidatus Marinamargulisbacteria bacterium SCGC AG-410-N11]
MTILKLSPKEGSKKKRRRVGRGNASGFGGECGRGHKGQRSRSGFKSRPGFEGGQMPLYKRLPKRRGIKNLSKEKMFVINLDTIQNHYNDGDEVNIESLITKGFINKQIPIKLLANGDLTKKVSIKLPYISKAALIKLEKSGSSFEISN